MRKEAPLRLWTFEDRTAKEALDFVTEILAGEIKRGFVFTPARAFFCFLRHADGLKSALIECDGSKDEKPVELGAAFELRLFGAHYEARWERMSGTKGSLVICSDGEADRHSENKERLEKLGARAADRPAFVRDHCYLLWGESTGDRRTALTRLATARIGSLWAPVDSDGERFVLTAREYFERKDFGNVVFVGERLTGIRPAEANDAAHLGATL